MEVAQLASVPNSKLTLLDTDTNGNVVHEIASLEHDLHKKHQKIKLHNRMYNTISSDSQDNKEHEGTPNKHVKDSGYNKESNKNTDQDEKQDDKRKDNTANKEIKDGTTINDDITNADMEKIKTQKVINDKEDDSKDNNINQYDAIDNKDINGNRDTHDKVVADHKGVVHINDNPDGQRDADTKDSAYTKGDIDTKSDVDKKGNTDGKGDVGDNEDADGVGYVGDKEDGKRDVGDKRNTYGKEHVDTNENVVGKGAVDIASKQEGADTKDNIDNKRDVPGKADVNGKRSADVKGNVDGNRDTSAKAAEAKATNVTHDADTKGDVDDKGHADTKRDTDAKVDENDQGDTDTKQNADTKGDADAKGDERNADMKENADAKGDNINADIKEDTDAKGDADTKGDTDAKGDERNAITKGDADAKGDERNAITKGDADVKGDADSKGDEDSKGAERYADTNGGADAKHDVDSNIPKDKHSIKNATKNITFTSPLHHNCTDHVNPNPFCVNYTFANMLYPKDVCGSRSEDVFLVMVITSIHQHRHIRDKIRKTWASPRNTRHGMIRSIFLLAYNGNDTLEKELKEEHETHGDILQDNFIDDYRNLTLKTIMALQWYRKSCQYVKFFMKTDDDMFINTFALLDYLNNIRKSYTRVMIGCCYTHGGYVHRKIQHKWFVSLQQFQGKMYPPYCAGTGYVLSGQVALDVAHIMDSIPNIPIEDAYVGICINQLPYKVAIHNLGNHFNINLNQIKRKEVKAKIRNSQIFTLHHTPPERLLQFWIIAPKS